MADGGDHDADGEAVGEREAEGVIAALSGGAEVLVGADGADREEDYGESADRIRRVIFG